jgi:translation initiation factor 3 subunit C
MSRFFHGGESSSESSSSEEEELYGEEAAEEEESEEESSEEDSDASEESSDEEGDKKATGADKFLRNDFEKADSDSESEDGVKVVKSAKDKKLEEIDATIRLIENAEKINDWAVISAGKTFP